MSERRVFLYPANVDEAFKEAAKKSLIDANWIPVYEISAPVQVLACTGADRQTCLPLRPDEYYAIVAERT